MNRIFRVVLSAIFVMTTAQISFAEESGAKKPSRKSTVKAAYKNKSTDDIFRSLDYPELQVVPLASQRLQDEAKDEKENWWWVHWPFQVSAASTFVVGLIGGNYQKDDLSSEEKEDANLAQSTALLIGGAWLAGNFLLALNKPYGSSLKDVAAVKGQSKRARLHRERLAEEALERPASLTRRLAWFSFLSNVAVNMWVGSNYDQNGAVFTTIASLAAAMPLIFPHNYQRVYNKHLEYKKRIYAPVVGMNMKFDAENKKASPMVSLNWSF